MKKLLMSCLLIGSFALQGFAPSEQLKEAQPNLNNKLLIAAQYGRSDEVRCLLDRGAQINAATIDGHTPLYIASEHGHYEAVLLLLEKGADPNKAASSGETPLYAATDNKHYDVARLLLEKGADPNKEDCADYTPLYNAAEYGHYETVRLLLDKGADPNKAGGLADIGFCNDAAPLYIASHYGHYEVVRLLLERGAQVDSITDGETVLDAAIESEHYDVVRLLLEKGADPNKENYAGYTPLYIASDNGHYEAVRLLLERGARVDTINNGETALEAAIECKHLEIVKLIAFYEFAEKDSMPHINQDSIDGTTPEIRRCLDKAVLTLTGILLDKARSNADPRTMLAAVNAGADINVALVRDGLTPLHYAVLHNNTNMARYLLAHGANIDARDIKGNTPLHIAILKQIEKLEPNRSDMIKLLLSKGARVDIQNHERETSVQLAASIPYIIEIFMQAAQTRQTEAELTEPAAKRQHK
jgi:ankyrin